MKKSVPYLAAFVFSVSGTGVCISLSAHADTLAPITRAITDPRRPIDQVKLDVTRKPAQLLAFAQLKPGAVVADFMPGNAYFTRLLSDMVGARGHVYAFLPAADCELPAKRSGGAREVSRDASYANVSVLSDASANFRVPEKLDLIWTAQNYHDLHDSFMGPADVAALNRAFFTSLKPGGVFLVIDHAAKWGSGARDTETLHRIDPQRLRAEIEAAGFVLEARSNLLRNPQDDHSLSVFDDRVRGRTDQVIYRFRRPK